MILTTVLPNASCWLAIFYDCRLKEIEFTFEQGNSRNPKLAIWLPIIYEMPFLKSGN